MAELKQESRDELYANWSQSDCACAPADIVPLRRKDCQCLKPSIPDLGRGHSRASSHIIESLENFVLYRKVVDVDLGHP